MTNDPDDLDEFDGSDDDLLRPFQGDGDDWLEELRDAESPRTPGRISNYEVLDEVRGGGQGLVFRARQAGTGRLVALKRLMAGTWSTNEERRRFEREIDTVMSLSHPGIVTVYGTEQVDDAELLVMEWVDGRPISEWSAALPGGHADRTSRLQAFLQVCEAVQYAHQRGVIHRDLKPGNVLVDDEGRCRVLDFGMARRLDDGASAASLTHGFVGTPAYAAPEHFTEGRAPLDVRSDVYSLGVILYELLSGQRPFAAESLSALIEQVTDREPRRLGDREVDAVLGTALAKDPARRYATVHAFADDVRRLCDGRAVAAVPPSAGYLLRTWVRRQRVVAGLTGALLVVLGFVGVFGYVQAARIQTEKDRADGQAEKAREEQRRADDEASKAREEKRRADDEAAKARGAKERADQQASKARTVANFYLDILNDIGPEQQVHSKELFDVFLESARGAREFFHEFPDAAVEVEGNLAEMMLRRGRLDECRELLEDAYALHQQIGGPESMAGKLKMTLANQMLVTGKQDQALSLYGDAIVAFGTDEEPMPAHLSSAFWGQAKALIRLGRSQEAISPLEEVIRIASEIPDDDKVLGARAALAGIRCRAGDEAAFDELKRLFEQVEAAPSTRNLRYGIALAYGDAIFDRGDSKGAIAPYLIAYEMAATIMESGHPFLAACAFKVARAKLNVNDNQEAIDWYGKSIEIGLASDLIAWANLGRAECAFRLKQYRPAADWFQAGAEALTEQEMATTFYGIHAYTLLINARVQLGETDQARDLLPKLQQAIRAYSENGTVPEWMQKHIAEIDNYFADK